jgi:hypothetical protein
LVSDGLHQTKPEWFTVSRNEKMSITLETNARLNAAPTIPAVVGIDLLRAKIPKATPEQILYTVSRAPIHGEILLNKKKSVRQFTQADINNRLVYYKSNSAKLGGWSQKDYFNFIVSVNSSANKGLRDEFRFRIQTSFAWIPADELGQFVSTRPVVVGRGKSCKITHFDNSDKSLSFSLSLSPSISLGLSFSLSLGLSLSPSLILGLSLSLSPNLSFNLSPSLDLVRA